MSGPIYLDCAASTPLDPRVGEAMLRCLRDAGNPGSRTHEHGAAARRAVERARDQLAAVLGCGRGELVFTSGATESNNLALLGLAPFGRRAGRRHLVASAIEHRAVLEPLRALADFELTLVAPRRGGWVDPGDVAAALRPDTLLVSVMQVNNETGVRQPIERIAAALGDHPAYFHVDAAQGFGRGDPRVDLVSLSGHKIHGPQGSGALVVRRRGRDRPPLEPLFHGGGQELGLRPGTLPVHQIVGLGLAAEFAASEAVERAAACRHFGATLLDGLAPLVPQRNGDPEACVPHIASLSFPGLDAALVIEHWRGLASVSDGAACTSELETCSHVLSAMGLPPERIEGAVRLSWCHDTPLPDLPAMVAALFA